MKNIRFGAVKPEGALKESIRADMDGCIGHLEELAPSILCDQQIYGRDRLSNLSKQAELGRKLDEHTEFEGTHPDAQFMWWNSESQSNWRDGFVRAALLLDSETLRKKADDYIAGILDTQDEDGYLGIYAPDLRYRQTGENGELWAKSTLYRVLLGYYEATGESRVLEALRRAFENLMKGYPMGSSDPFRLDEQSFSGHCHGLTIVDALNEMTELTGDTKYLDYAVWLYERYSANQVEEEDLKISNIENPFYLWKNHGVHLYEHFRAVILAACHRPKYRTLLSLVLSKLPYYLTPSGGPAGDEWVLRRTADATKTGYEFCSVTELFDSYALLMKKTGDGSVADLMEWLYFNAGMGMKHPLESSIMYCKTDNCYSADRRRNPQDVYPDERYKYSPVHQTTAVCCIPNMGRLTPHYVQDMYLPAKDGFTAVLYGESLFRHSVDGVPVTVRQITSYPARLGVTFEISVERPVRFSFGLRKPGWAEGYEADCALREEENRLVLEREWAKTSRFTVQFHCGVKIRTDLNRDYYVTRGPLVYALPIAAKERALHTYAAKPFREVGYESIQRERETLMIHEDDRDTFVYHEPASENWREQSITGCFFDGKNRQTLSMVPMGGTILRKVTFQIGLGGNRE